MVEGDPLALMNFFGTIQVCSLMLAGGFGVLLVEIFLAGKLLNSCKGDHGLCDSVIYHGAFKILDFEF